MINVMTGRKLHMTDSNLLQLITSFIFGIFWQGFPCFTVSAVTVFYIYILSQNSQSSLRSLINTRGPSHKNKQRFFRDKPCKLISN